MEILSRPINEMLDHYSVVVIGSGYGGAITAARIARAGQSVCILERGKELHPGEYPNSGPSALREIQVHTPTNDYGSAEGMFDFHVGHDITVLAGCGLGGTSLINGNVALEPRDSIFSDPRWPEPLRDHPEILKPFMQAARGMLGSNPYPRSWPELPKLQALERVAAALGVEVSRPDINVTFVDGPNAVGLQQNACTLCGDCCAGCNYGAKNSVLMNYLPDAHWHGAHIFTEVAVRSVQRLQGKWQVAYSVPADGKASPSVATSRSVLADVVVLAAGTLGSTQILLRSRDLGLPVSDRLGLGFSGNGDVLAFAYDTDAPVRGVGLAGRLPREDTLVGPAITGLVDLRGSGLRGGSGGGNKDALIIEEGSIPGAIAAVLPIVMDAASYEDLDEQTASVARRLRELAEIPLSSYHGPVDRTLTYLVMSTDDSGGQVVLENDRINVVWPGVAEQPVFAHDNQVLAAATEALHGTEIADPLWARTGERSLITVHPLGGCVMADDASDGVVDHMGRVFDPVGGGVHDGLYVCDGSVIPVALDANPLLTISAIAERTAALMIEERKWQAAQPTEVTLSAPLAPPVRVEPVLAEAAPRASLEFTEHLTGFLSMSVHDGYAAGYEDGREDGARVDLFLTIGYDDIQAVLDDPKREARITGTVLAPELSTRPLIVTEGRFTLLDPDRSQVETWHMRYRMRLRSEEGKEYLFDGHKVARSVGAGHAWSEMTTLYTTIRAADGPKPGGPEPGEPEPGTGILHLKPADFARLVRSIKVTGVPRREQGEYHRAFMKLFVREMVDIYGGVLDEPGAFPSAPRKAPAVREPKDPDGIWWCDGLRRWHVGDKLGDDAFLRLTRYRAGDKGPLMLATGFGMSSHSFLVPTVEQNLTEFLAECGYDVWLFDYRAGIDLPSAGTEFTIDDIAREDWPTAVRKVQEETGREDLQAFGHCVGSVSLQMAILAGLQGIRTAVCAQFPLHPASSVFNMVKAHLHTADVLGTLGVGVVTPDTRPSLRDETLDMALRALPMPAEEHCSQAVCRWINAIYGCTHRHAQLNEATHRAINDMFGFGNIESMEHLSLMLRKGHAVTHTGGMDYFDHPERMAGTRLLLLQGMRNYIFHPAGSFRTWRWLRSQNPMGDFQRKELPGYAHLDAIVGARAAVEVYPLIAEFLDGQ
jgi:cholesterol oxidase